MGMIGGWSKYESTQTAQDLVAFKTTVNKEYVTLERYKCDTERIEKGINRIDDKLDILMQKVK
jgi:hypothetical protein